jgi:hypothetical protein
VHEPTQQQALLVGLMAASAPQALAEATRWLTGQIPQARDVILGIS